MVYYLDLHLYKSPDYRVYAWLNALTPEYGIPGTNADMLFSHA